jgi:hypothetical protein
MVAGIIQYYHVFVGLHAHCLVLNFVVEFCFKINYFPS